MESISLYAFFIGLSYGSSACLFSCLPFLSPILLANGVNSKAISVLTPFSLGRVTTYVFISAVAFSSSAMIQTVLNEGVGKFIIGSATIALGSLLLFRSVKSKSCCTAKTNPTTKTGYFILGIGISFNLCAPVLTLIGLSANGSSILISMSYGLFFGLGAISATYLLFLVLISPIAKGVLEEFKSKQRVIEIISSLLLIVLGVLTLLGKVSL